MNNKTESNTEKAGKYLETAKINQENLWKRRQVEWRTAFSLWTAIAIASVYIYIDVEWPSRSPFYFLFPAGIIIVYLIAVCIHCWHHKRLFTSNENLRYIGGSEIRQVLIGNELTKKGYKVSFITYDEKGEKENNFRDINIIKSFSPSKEFTLLKLGFGS